MLRGTVIACVASAAVYLFAGGDAARAQLVNGSFNSPSATNTVAGTGSTALTGWFVDQLNNGIAFGTAFGSTPGLSSTQSVQLGTGSTGSFKGGGIHQTITTVPGQIYTIAVEGKSDNGVSTTAGTVNFGGQSFSFNGLSKTNWKAFTFTPTATSSSTTLDITGNTATTDEAIVDDLSMVLAQVPTIWLGQSSSDTAVPANWSTGYVPSGQGVAVTFGTAGANPAPTLLSSSQTAGIVNFVDSVSTNLSASSGYYLYLDDTNGSSAMAAINVSGNHTISAPIQLNSSAAFNVTAGTDQLTVSGVIANGANGPQGISLSGSGTLNLTAANTFSGSVSVASGTLLLSNSAALQNATLAGGGVSFAGGITTAVLGGLSGSGGFALATVASQPVALAVGNNAQSTTYSGALSGAGSLTKIGGGALTLGGANTFTGATLVSGGTLALGTAAALQDSNLDPSGAGTVSFGGLTAATLGGITNAGTLVLANTAAQPVALSVGNNNQTTTFAGSLQDAGAGGSLTKIGSGALYLTGNNTYSGGSNVSAGTLQFQGASAFPAGSPVGLGAGTFSLRIDGSGSGGTISSVQNTAITLSAATTATIDAGSLTGSQSGNTVVFGALSNGTTGNAFNSQINFTGANGYVQSFSALNLSGLTGQGTALNPVSTSVIISGNVINQESGSASGHFDTLTLAGATAGNVIYGSISDSSVFVSVGSGDTRITKTGSSQWTLANPNNSYSGPTTISGGTLQLGTGVSGQDGTLGNTSGVTNNGALVYDMYASQTAYSAISGTGSVTMIGPGIISLAASNTYTGPTYVQNGTLALGSGGGLQSSSISIAAGATFDVSSVSPGFHLASGQSLSGSGNYNVNGAMTANAGSLILPGGAVSAGTMSVGGLTLSPGGSLSYDLGSGQDLIDVTGALNVNGGGFNLYQANGTSAFTSPGTYTLMTYGSLYGSPANLSVLNASATNTYSFAATGGSLDVTIQAPYTWTGLAGAPFNWSNGNNWSTQQAPASGQSIEFSGSVGLTNNNDLNLSGGSLTGIVFAPSAGSFTLSGNGVPLAGALVNYSAANQTINLPVTLIGGNQNVIAAGGNITLSGAIDDGGQGYGLNVSGSGTVVLAGANTFSGTTNVASGGSLRLANNAALQDSTLNLPTGGSLSFTVGATSPIVAGLTGSGNVSLATSSNQAVVLSVGGNGQSTTYSGVLSGAGGLVKQGNGTLTLATGQSYGGATRIAGGVLQILPPPPTGSIGIQIKGNGTAITGSDGPAGAVMSNWNVVTGTPPSGSNLVDNSNRATGCAITITGTSGGGSGAIGPISGVTDPLLSGYYYYGNTSGLITATITGIPYQAYTLYTFSQDETASHTNNLTMGGQTFYYTAEGISTFAQITNTNPSSYPTGNYAVVTGLSGGSQQVSIYSPQDTGLSGFEIVSTSTGGGSSLPSTTPLTISGGGTFDMTNCQQTVASLSSTDGMGSQVLLGYGALTVAGTAITTFDGVISGAGGSLIAQGGRLTLTGQNTYTGATTITGGTLQLAGGGPTGDGSIAGTSVVNDNGTLLYSYTDNQSIAYSTGGIGSLVKAGTAALSLTGNSTYTGATTIGGGTLQLGNGNSGQDGSIAGTSVVVNNAALVFDLAGTQTAVYPIGGGGSLSMIGAGMLTLSGTNTYRGGTYVEAGTLVAANNEAIADGTSLTVGNPSYFSPLAPAAASAGVASAASGTAPVPEPGTLALLVAGAALMAMYRKRR